VLLDANRNSPIKTQRPTLGRFRYWLLCDLGSFTKRPSTDHRLIASPYKMIKVLMAGINCNLNIPYFLQSEQSMNLKESLSFTIKLWTLGKENSSRMNTGDTAEGNEVHGKSKKRENAD